MRDLFNHGTDNIVRWLRANHIEYSWAGDYHLDPEGGLMAMEWEIMLGGSETVVIEISKNDYMRFKLAF